MPKSNEELREQISDMLILFVDFIYALVFWQIVSEMYTKVVEVEAITLGDFVEKAKNFVGIFAIFYFLVWDWIGSRILTVKNPYKGFTRFFIELAVAFCAYGAVLEVVNQSLFFLCYVATMLLLGVIWAQRTIREHPESTDLRELDVILWTHSIGSLLALTVFFLFHYYFQYGLNKGVVLTVIILEWFFVLVYEVFVPRTSGILGGAQMTMVSRKKAGWIRDKYSSVKSFLPKKKGSQDE